MSRPAITQGDFASSTPRAFCVAIDHRLGRDVAPAEVFGQRPPDELPVDARVERLEWNGLHAGRLLREREARPRRRRQSAVADVRRRLKVAGGRPERLERRRQHGSLDDGLGRLLAPMP